LGLFIGLAARARANVFDSFSIDGWTLLLLLSGTVGCGLFAWGVRGHFVGDKTPGGMQIVLALSLVGSVVFPFDLLRTPDEDWRRALGFAMHLLAIALFAWAVLATRRDRPALAFAGERPNHLFRSGPYASIRHPFYASYLLFWAGSAVATSSLILALIFVAFAVIYTIAARTEERNFLSSPMHDEYEAFRQATGLFWPKIRLPRPRLPPVSLRQPDQQAGPSEPPRTGRPAS
jgi:protein-S-isoprenylcysteine O-methyltransferase Ste14